MCEYCKLEKGVEGEWYNNNQRIGLLSDGSFAIELSLNRYITDDGAHDSDLITELCVDINNGLLAIKNEKFKIKYCPFCGEEL